MINSTDLQKWFITTESGRYILRHEKLFYHNVVSRVFGYYSLQIEFPEINFLENNKIPNCYILNQDVKSKLTFLPFADNSIDLIICPHILELTSDYYYLLKECYRILIPNGKIIFTCFSASSIFKIVLKSNLLFKSVNFMSFKKLQTQLNALGFNIDGGKFLCYTPLFNNKKFLANFSFMDKIGDRWMPTCANIFAISATKELITHNLIKTAQLKPKEDIARTAQLGTTKVW